MSGRQRASALHAQSHGQTFPPDGTPRVEGQMSEHHGFCGCPNPWYMRCTCSLYSLPCERGLDNHKSHDVRTFACSSYQSLEVSADSYESTLQSLRTTPDSKLLLEVHKEENATHSELCTCACQYCGTQRKHVLAVQGILK